MVRHGVISATGKVPRNQAGVYHCTSPYIFGHVIHLSGDVGSKRSKKQETINAIKIYQLLGVKSSRIGDSADDKHNINTESIYDNGDKSIFPLRDIFSYRIVDGGSDDYIEDKQVYKEREYGEPVLYIYKSEADIPHSEVLMEKVIHDQNSGEHECKVDYSNEETLKNRLDLDTIVDTGQARNSFLLTVDNSKNNKDYTCSQPGPVDIFSSLNLTYKVCLEELRQELNKRRHQLCPVYAVHTGCNTHETHKPVDTLIEGGLLGCVYRANA